LAIAAMSLCLTVLSAPHCLAQGRWQGVDESVVEKVARQAGRPPQPPLLPTDQGDLQLFAFLLAGAIGGFIAGYTFRGLFPPSQHPTDHHAPPQ
jgi:cobalt/nickel transport system permease protein